MQENSTKQQILELLREKTFGLTIEETSNNLKISRSTGSKYLAILEAEKRVVVRCIGKAKLYYFSEYYPPNGHFDAKCTVLGNGTLMVFLASMLLSFSVMGHAAQNGFLLNTDQDAYGINRDIYVFISGPNNADFTVKIFDPQGTLVGKKTDRTSPGGSAYLHFSGFSEAGDYGVKLEYGGETVNEKTFQVLPPGTEVCENCMPRTTTTTTTTNTALPATTTATTTITMIHTTTCTITKTTSGAAELGGTDAFQGTTNPLGENETAEPGTLTDIVPPTMDNATENASPGETSVPSPSPPQENVSDAENNITNESLPATETPAENSSATEASNSSTPPKGVSVVDIDPLSAEAVKGMNWEKICIVNAALNADEENEQTLTFQAKGRTLYSCSDWDPLEKKCRIPWEKEQDISPGEEYSLSPEEGPIVYAEGVTAYSLNIDSDKEFEPDEDPMIEVMLSDEEDKALDSQIEARLLTPEGEIEIAPEEIKKRPEGGYRIEINKRRGFAPGLNRIRIDTQYEGIPYTADYEFLWGVLAVNTDKSMYLPDETANISMAVLDNQGHMVCDANVTLSIRDPSNTETVLSTENGGIQVSDECGYYGVTTLPDYYTAYQVAEVGTYLMNLTAETADGTRSISEGFTVESAVDYDVTRNGPTRIYPPAKYTMSFTIKPNKEYSGDIIEIVPAGFEITPQEGLSVEEAGDEKRLIWAKNLERDETLTLSYEFDAPDISPYLYTLGPLSIGDFAEMRQWMIASDAAGISGMATYQLSAQATTPAWMNWTGSAWSAKNNANAVSGTVQWTALKANPVRTEKILVTLDNQNDVIAQIWNGASWTSQTMTDNANLNTKKAFAAGVMKSGKVMVAYNNNTAGMVAYKTWDGSSWSDQQNLTIGGSAQIEWMEIASSNQSDRLMLVVQTAVTSTYADIYAVPWNGTNWLTPVQLEDQSDNTSLQNFDVAFEYSSDEVLVVWSDQALTTVQHNTYSFSSGWGTPGTGYNVGTANIISFRLAPYPGTNRIMMCCLEDATSADIDCQEWDGGAWQIGARPDGTVEVWSSTRNFDVAPNVATGGFLFIYGDSNDDWYDFFQCTSQANCQAGTWVTYTTWSTTDIGTDTSWAQLYPAFNEPGRFTAIMLDQLTTTGWRRGRISCDASGCTSLEAPTAWGAVSSVAYESASFAYDIYEPPKPNNNTIWDETDPKQYGGATKYKNQPVMFYANYTNTTGYPINATLAPDAYCRITIYNVSYWTMPVNMEYNGTKLLYQYNMTGGFSYPGNYSWNVTCNATGFRGNFTTDKVYINNTAPETVVDGPISTNWFARSNTAILLRCNASDYEDPITSLKVHFQWDASAGYSSPTIPVVNNSATQNPFIVTFNAQTDAECSAAGIGATGRCYFQCYANDSLKAIDATPAQNSFGIDGEAPIGYAAGMQGKTENTWMNGTSFTIVCTGATDPNSGSGVSTYDYEYTATDDCSGGWSAVTGCTDIAGTCSWTSPPHDETGFCLRCRATDAVGNDGSWDNAQYGGIDNTAPSSCSMTRPLQYYNITSSPYTLASDESDAGSGMQNVTFQYYYDEQWKLACAGTSAAQSYNCSWTVPAEIENLRNVSIRAVCFDVVNYSLASANVSNVTADAVNSNPVCTVSYPNGYENVSGTIVVNASASDIDPTDYVNNVSFNYSSDGVTWNYISTNATPGLTSYAVSWDTSGKNGNNYRIRCLAADSRGGYGQDESDAPYTVDNTPPTVSAESVNATSISISEYVCLNLTATDNIKVEKVWAEIDVPSPGLDASIELYDNGIGCDAAASDDVYSAEYQSTYDGTYTWIGAYANDTAGNLRTTTPGKSWTVSSTASMTAKMENPAADIRINESNGGNSYVQGCNVTCDQGGATCNDVILYTQYRPDTWVDITTSTTELTNAEDEHSCGSLTQGQTCRHDFTVTSGSHSGGSSWEIRCRATSTTASQSNSPTFNVTINDMPHAAWFHPSYEGQWLSGIVNLNASSSSDADGTITRYVYHLDDNPDFTTPFLLCDTADSNCTFDTTGQTECAQNDNINCHVRVNVTDNYGASNHSVRG